MYNSKLYSILNDFNKYEQNRCRKYILSPYFNKNQGIIELFEGIIGEINQTSDAKFTKELLWERMEPGKLFSDVRFRKYCSDLLKLLEGFLAQEVYQENPLHQATYLIEAVSQRKFSKLFNSTLRTARRLSDQQRLRPASYYFYQYEIERNFYSMFQFDSNKKEVANIEDIANNLDYFFIAEKLRYYVAVLNRQYEIPHEYEIRFMEDIIKQVEKLDHEEIPPVAVYYQLYLAMTDSENEKHYFKLKNLLQKYGLLFPEEEASLLYNGAVNYCTRKINKGRSDFLREYFDLYKDLLEKEIIIVDEELDPRHFKNLVLAGLRLGEIDWTDNFIKSYQIYLPDNERENAVTFNLAQLYFYKKNYDKVIEMLHNVEYNDLAYNLNSKVFLLQTYFEIDEIEALYSLLESFRAFLNRRKNIPARRKKSYLNLIRFTKKLTKVLPGDKRSLERLKNEMNEAQGVASVRWLNEKIAELEG